MDGHAVSCIPAVADCYGALALELGGVPTQALAVIVGTWLREQAVGDFGDVLAASTREVGAGMHAEFATAVETEEPGRLASAFLDLAHDLRSRGFIGHGAHLSARPARRVTHGG